MFGQGFPNGQSADGLFGQGRVQGQSGEEELNYPSFYFLGEGCMTTRGNGAAIVKAFSTHAERDHVKLKTTAFGAKSHTTPHSDDVNETLGKNIGESTIHKLDPTKLTQLRTQDENYKKGSFLYFTDKIVTSGGNTFTFDNGIPALIWPSPEVRFESLKNGQSLSFSSKVNSSQVGEFEVQISIKEMKRSGNQIYVAMQVNIPMDSNGRYYGVFPLPKDSISVIDMQERRILSRAESSRYHDSKEGTHAYHKISMSAKLCKVESQSETETLGPCQPDRSVLGSVGANHSCIMQDVYHSTR